MILNVARYTDKVIRIIMYIYCNQYNPSNQQKKKKKKPMYRHYFVVDLLQFFKKIIRNLEILFGKSSSLMVLYK